MPARRNRRFQTVLALAAALTLPQSAGAQEPGDFRAMTLADVTKWLEKNLPDAAQLHHVRIDDDDEGPRRVEASLQVVGVQFTGCSMAFRERLTIDNKKAEVRRWSVNLAGLARDIVAVETPAADGQMSPSRWWTLLIRDANGRAGLRATGEEGTPTMGRAGITSIQIPDQGKAERVASALSAAAARCRARS
jgi:hypothetical protein